MAHSVYNTSRVRNTRRGAGRHSGDPPTYDPRSPSIFPESPAPVKAVPTGRELMHVNIVTGAAHGICPDGGLASIPRIADDASQAVNAKWNRIKRPAEKVSTDARSVTRRKRPGKEA